MLKKKLHQLEAREGVEEIRAGNQNRRSRKKGMKEGRKEREEEGKGGGGEVGKGLY